MEHTKPDILVKTWINPLGNQHKKNTPMLQHERVLGNELTYGAVPVIVY
jgi:hypothetical protein